MKLISQWWIPEDESRLAELEFCKKKNKEVFDEQVYLDGSDGSLTYRQLFSEAKDGELVVVANTDVWFDDTIDILKRICEPNVFAALTRWNSASSPNMSGWVVANPGDGEYDFHDTAFFSGTQDAWVFTGCERIRNAPEIPIGTLGCDQAIAAWAAINKFFVIDPALSVKCWHAHAKRASKKPVGPYVAGMYGYPQLTNEEVTGVVATHAWGGDGKKIWRLFRCQR